MSEEATSFRVVLLEKDGDMQTIMLPAKREGRYTFFSGRPGEKKPIIQIDGNNGVWYASCIKKSYFVLDQNTSAKTLVLGNQVMINVVAGGDIYVLYVESGPEKNRFVHYYVEPHNEITIGRLGSNDISYPSKWVSGEHAALKWKDGHWYISDLQSRNGVYLNGHRLKNVVQLHTGDIIYIMGLYIVFGIGFVAMNNEDGRARILSPKLRKIINREDAYFSEGKKNEEDHVFDRVIRSAVDISAEDIEIEMPPMPLSSGNLPFLLRLGSPLMSGGTAVLMGNYLSLATSLLMPALTQGYTEKQRKEYEAKRKEVYGEYLRLKREEIKKEAEREETLLKRLYPDTKAVLGFALTKSRLWERRKYDEDFLRVRIGYGDIPMLAGIKYQKRRLEIDPDELVEDMYKLAEEEVLLKDTPLLLDLRTDYVVGIIGKASRNIIMINYIIRQLAATHSFDEVKIVILATEADRDAFSYVRFLPHNWDNNKNLRFYAENISDTQQIIKHINKENETIAELKKQRDINTSRFPSYVVIATNKELYDSVDYFRDIQENEKYNSFSLVSAYEGIPKECKKVIKMLSDEKAVLIDLYTPGAKEQLFQLDDVKEDYKKRCMREIMRTKLNIEGMKYTLPTMLTFLELYRVGRVEHLNPLERWKNNNPVKSLAVPIGIGKDGKEFMLDLHEKYHGPHGLIAGGTGSGKSEFIITYILSMAVNFSPDEVAFVLIDYKGGGLADAFVSEKKGIHLPHVVGTITNLDGAGITRSLMSINSELKRRQTLFKEAKGETDEGTMDIYDYQKLYRSGRVREPLPHLFIISDEFAELKKQQPEFMDELISTARIGRSLGVHLILATQRPTGVVNDQIWSNSKFRVCLKVAEKSDSMEMLKRPEAAEIKNTGRFYLQVGYNELFAMGQSAWCGADYTPGEIAEGEEDISVSFLDNTGRTIVEAKPLKEAKENEGKQIVSIVQYLSDLSVREGIMPRMLWKDEIPAKLEYGMVEKLVKKRKEGVSALIGLVDDPAHQSQFPLIVDMGSFRNMAVIGPSGSGKSAFIRTMLWSMVSNYSPEEMNYYIVDLSGGTLGIFRELPHCGAYITDVNESEFDRLMAMFREMAAERRNLFRKAGVSGFEAYQQIGHLSMIYLIIDSYQNIAANFAKGPEIHAYFHGFLADIASCGIHVILTANHSNEISTKEKMEIDKRFALNPVDKYAASEIISTHVRNVPRLLPGRGMCVVEERSLEFHVAVPYVNEAEQSALQNMRDELLRITAPLADKGNVRKLPVMSGGQTYREFANGFESGRIPLGYSAKDMKPVALPLRQWGCLTYYFGNPAGVRPVLKNMLYAAELNRMEVLVIKKNTDSAFDSQNNLLDGFAGDSRVYYCNEESIAKLMEELNQEILKRNELVNEYSEQNGIPREEHGRAKKAAGYIMERTVPMMILIESLMDFCQVKKDSITDGFFQGFFAGVKGYNIYFLGCAYPEDALRTNSMAQKFLQEGHYLFFGGRYNMQGLVTNIPPDMRKIEKVNKLYDRYVMRYRDEWYDMQMPCGKLVYPETSPDEEAII